MINNPDSGLELSNYSSDFHQTLGHVTSAYGCVLINIWSLNYVWFGRYGSLKSVCFVDYHFQTPLFLVLGSQCIYKISTATQMMGTVTVNSLLLLFDPGLVCFVCSMPTNVSKQMGLEYNDMPM